MKYIAVVTSTQYGQTTKIAERMRDILAAKGYDAHLFPMREAGDLSSAPASRFDAAIVGGPVYAGKYSPILLRWTKAHVDALNRMPCAFFSVSLNAADAREEARKEDRRLIKEFLRLTGLRPLMTASLIGAVHYRKYNFLMRWIMRRICGASGGPTDTSRDHELTDWNAVAKFVEEFAQRLQPVGDAPGTAGGPAAFLV
jgi:menaquinone-dependent protoporphyrinogen oxidase